MPRNSLTRRDKIAVAIAEKKRQSGIAGENAEKRAADVKPRCAQRVTQAGEFQAATPDVNAS